MPNITMTLKDIQQSVNRPVIMDMIRQVREITKITDEAETYFPGDVQRMRTQGSSLDDDKNKLAVMENKRVLFIEVEDDFDPESVLMTSVSRMEHDPVFVDKTLGVYIAPVYTVRNVKINFKYQTPSKTEAERWAADMRIRLSNMRDMNLHEVNYSFPIPEELWEIVEHIHELREQTAGYGEDLGTYVLEHTTRRLKIVGGEAGIDPRIVIAENQDRIQGLYDFSGLPEKPQRDEGSGSWVVSFPYKFTYDMPVACNMRYPIMIHNQLLPERFVLPMTPEDPAKKRLRASQTFRAWKKFEQDTALLRARDQDPFIRIPKYDDFELPNLPSGTGLVMLVLTQIDDPAEKRTLLDLNELGDYALDADIIKFMKESEYPHMSSPYTSIFQVGLYRNNKMAEERMLEVTSDLMVKSKIDLDLRDVHRVRISIVTNLTMLSPAALDRLRANPVVFVKVMNAISELLRNQSDFQNLGSRKIIDELTFDRVYNVLQGLGGYYNKNFPKTTIKQVPSRVPVSGWYGSPARNYAYVQRQQAAAQTGRGVHNPQTVKGAFDDIDPQILNKFWHMSKTTNFRTVQTSWIISHKYEDLNNGYRQTQTKF